MPLYKNKTQNFYEHTLFKMLVIIFIAIRIIVIHHSKMLKILQCHSGNQCGRIFWTRKWHSAHSASFSACRWGQSTIKHLLGEQMPSLSTVAKLQFDFVSINGIFKSSTELKGIRTNIYWGSYWNWQARIVFWTLEKERQAQMTGTFREAAKLFLQGFQLCRIKTIIPHEGLDT